MPGLQNMTFFRNRIFEFSRKPQTRKTVFLEKDSHVFWPLPHQFHIGPLLIFICARL